VIVDTSVWVDHLRRDDRRLAALLHDGAAELHPFVLCELALGNLGRRDEILGWLEALPSVEVAADAEVRYLIEERRLWGRGIGWIDAHLLASALLGSTPLLTRDRALAAVAVELGVAGD